MKNDRFANSRTAVALNLLSATLVRIQSWLSRRHLDQQYPQLAIFAFDHIGIRINAFGRYENDVLHALVKFLEKRGKLQGACLDVGANVGNHTLFFAKYFAQVHAFEPSRRTFVLLEENVRAVEHVVPHRVALSDVAGTLELTTPLENIGGASLHNAAHEGGPVQREVVQVTKLDTFDAISSLDINLIKIDVEGFEAEVLRGAESILRRRMPAVVFEQQPGDIINGSSQAIDLLKEAGYTKFYQCARWPATPLRILTIAAKLVLGEDVYFKEVGVFEKAYYPMIIGLS